ncbi:MULTISPECIES: pyridoxal phosphate-dependent aminotransferase [Prochlorococcus]|uniref:Aminotransferase n=1 Tax=Prochlorococcus marinus (strain SARG / CCMP1375 / SS120) TaxID=167539 RepID=Q7VDZ1_PROMA|nr:MULTISPECIES: aminotransferase class I/II-fold pyridoxal phosphate-dependent enzyme [Prochlorococcus]AAP99270.1 Histidinol-phosphate/aromatic aminotransferase related enzyme [Prochlorococcus marinus subsp. marinus str. CCMP1375]KGG11460.1 L-threonine 3-O-phosphate decarboxylase [Prochlorococcus marinus str. LG]KGG18585.1 L-threonine 3-O-phosphate decarboxylase [Prochlorococcus marinus str. SS2]KGG22858.1 L-threonine 3-O-phosphate decarboxylase [Prochlorococcus marinus str. SS35]KGG32734.1 L
MDLRNNYSEHIYYQNSLQHGGNLEQEAKRLGVHISSLIDASASLVPFSLSSPLHRCLINALKDLDLKIYPDRSHSALREAIAKHHKVHPSMVLPGNGASELITWAGRDASQNGLSILPSPGFSDYKRALKCWNGKYLYSPLPLKWTSKLPQLFPLKPSKHVIWVTNPHNPTGQCWSRDSLELLLKTHSLVICDEAFLPLVPNGEKESLIPLVENYSNLIVIRSLTKLFSIAGLRIGYAISTSKRLQQWQELRDPWPLNGLAISIGKMIMTDEKILHNRINQVHKWINEEGPWLQSNLQNLKGIIAHPSSTNFQLIESSQSLAIFRERLAKKNILLRDCSSFEGLGENWLRISLQKKSDNRRIIEAMQQVLKHIFEEC